MVRYGTGFVCALFTLALNEEGETSAKRWVRHNCFSTYIFSPFLTRFDLYIRCLLSNIALIKTTL